ncbi:MAG: helix-turn-helix transcriptional regulator [Opitutaceae bacterium]|nr:helix-turn-helix transcriptional regulator [Opitutaceae bacterium]
MLPSPAHPLAGKRATPLVLPDNIVCFCRRSASSLNRPQRGRALHHRFVLIFALRTGVTVRVDDTDVLLREGGGLLVFPFQFHDYMDARHEALQWLFITFDMVSDPSLEALRYRPFAITPAMARIVTDLVSAYLKTGVAADDVTTLLLALLLTHIKRSRPGVRGRAQGVAANAAPGTPGGIASGGPGLMTKVNELAENRALPPSVKEMASALGISASHLRARFRESCGVPIGKHVRRLRLEKARGLLRLSSRRVSEIAEMCGFSSIYTFSRAFHAAYGVAPLEYRKGAHIQSRTRKRAKGR